MSRQISEHELASELVYPAIVLIAERLKMASDEKTVSIKVCSEYLGITERHVYSLIDQGKLYAKTYEISGRKQKIREPYAKGLLAKIAEHRVEAQKKYNFFVNGETKLRNWINE